MPAARLLHSFTLLVADDDRSYRAFLTACLRGRGHQVCAVASGDEALTAWDAARGGFDLVMTDLQMPGLDGLALRDALLERDADACVVVITAGDGRTGVLPKPCTAEAVVELAEMTLAARGPLRSIRGVPLVGPPLDAPSAGLALVASCAPARTRAAAVHGATTPRQRTRWPPKSR